MAHMWYPAGQCQTLEPHDGSSGSASVALVLNFMVAQKRKLD